MTPHLDAVALLPELVVAVTLAVVLVVDLFVDDKRRGLTTVFSFAGTLGAFACVVGLALSDHHVSMINGSYVVDHFSLLSKALMLGCGAAVFLLGSPKEWKGEYCVLLLSSLLGMTMLPSSRDLLTFFVAFELMAVPGYMLAGWQKRSTHGHEAALKYYLLGVLATSVMLYGLSLLFGIAGTTTFTSISAALSVSEANVNLARLGVFFVLVGMGFKVAAVPFHFWAPDAYQGAPLPVAAFLSVAAKAAGLVALAELVGVMMPSADDVWSPLLWTLAVLSMTVGNLVALRQNDIVRMLAYSSIAQAGYLLVPLAVANHRGAPLDEALRSLFVYLLIYSAMNLGAFAAVIAVHRRTGSTDVSAFSGLFVRSPALAVVLSVHLLSLAGVPPMGGWFAKLVIFQTALDAHSSWAIALIVVAAVNTAIALVYYSVVVRQMWLSAPTGDTSEEVGQGSSVLPVGLYVVLGLATFVVILSGVVPGVVTHLGEFSSLAG